MTLAIGFAARVAIGPIDAVAYLVVGVIVIGCLVLAAGTGRLLSAHRAGIAVTSAWVALVLLGGYYGGGLGAPILAVAAITPLIATFLVSRAVALPVAILVALGLIGLDGLDRLGITPELQLAGGDLDAARLVALGLSVLAAGMLTRQHELESSRLRSELEVRAATDALTELPNRRSFDGALEFALAHAGRSGGCVAVILLDVDHFKMYNDTYGHQAGDRCLARVATLLRATVQRRTDTVARFGGEEFAAVLPLTTLGSALRVAEALRRAVEAEGLEHSESTTGVVTISVGVATATGGPPEGLLQRADSALYQAKELGRNRVMAGLDEPPGSTAWRYDSG